MSAHGHTEARCWACGEPANHIRRVRLLVGRTEAQVPLCFKCAVKSDFGHRFIRPGSAPTQRDGERDGHGSTDADPNAQHE